MPRRDTLAVQLSLPSVPLQPRPEAMRENRRISFGRVVMPYFFRIDPRNYTDITEAMIKAADPERLAPHLLPGRSRGRYSVDGVALGAADFEIVPRSLPAFLDAVGNRAERANLAKGANSDMLQRKGNSARLQALQVKLEAMQARQPILHHAQDQLAKLGKAAKHPGYAHMRSQELYDLAYEARYGHYGAMLGVVGREKEWTSQQSDLATRALDARLFLMPQTEKVANWQAMNELGLVYNAAVTEIYSSRILSAETNIDRIAQHVERPA